jgi:hypothetical protein
MIRIAFSTLFISLFCMSCGTEKNESSSDTLRMNNYRDCEKELNACKQKRESHSCNEKHKFCTNPEVRRTSECYDNGLC